MSTAKIAIVLAAAVWTAPFAMAATPYGQATVEQGQMTLLREGRRLVFQATPQKVQILEQDLIRVADKSRVLLETIEKTVLTLGANAVLQVEPWQQQEKRGTLKMAFGRVRAVATGLTGGEQFTFKSATATIGIKGTEWDSAVTVGGDAFVLVRDGNVFLAGPDGLEVQIPPDLVSYVFNQQGATAPQPIPEAARQAWDAQGLDSAVPWSPDPVGAVIAAIQELINAGIITQDTVDRAREGATEPPPGAEVPPPPAPQPTDVPQQEIPQAPLGSIDVQLNFEN